jgi:hypothetical protein
MVVALLSRGGHASLLGGGLLALALVSQARADSTLTLEGELPLEDLDHVFLDFEVPAGTAEIQIEHDDLSAENILDWGLYDPSGFRGWGGGNSEPIVVSADAASRSYLTGPISPGTWRVVVGKAKIEVAPAPYRVVVTLRDVATARAQTARRPYEDPGVLLAEQRWYAGDLHVHSRESGDAVPTLDEVATYARNRGLDFVQLSEHNTTSQLDWMGDAQSRAGELLLLPGVEFTTYDGHANGIGATLFVDHKIGQPGVTIEDAISAFHEQGALFSVNHPTLDVGDICIGCAWAHDVDPKSLDAIEIATAGSSVLFLQPTLDLWETWAEAGARLAAVGGSDDHRAGKDLGAFGAPIGTPTTMVYATELSTAGLLEGLREQRTVVKVRGPDDPMVDLSVVPGGERGVLVRATITGGAGLTARWITNGGAGDDLPIDADPLELALDVAPPEAGADRYRLEIWEGTQGVTFTSHVWVEPGSSTPPPADDVEPAGGGCTTSGARPSGVAGWFLLALALRARSRSARQGASTGRRMSRSQGVAPQRSLMTEIPPTDRYGA